MATELHGIIEEAAEALGHTIYQGTGETRQKIRESIELPAISRKSYEDFQNLRRRPDHPDWSISITHTKEFGGWVAVKRPLQVGFDVETLSRIQPATVHRISSDEEINQAADPRFIWSAKESYFKALEKHQPLTIGELKVGAWGLKGENFRTFKGEGPMAGQGILFVSGELLIALCFVQA